MIAIIDYGMGNLRSLQKGFEKIGAEAVITSEPDTVASAGKIVLPGVGAFRDCMRNLAEGGFVKPLLDAIAAGKPFLGICLGMQMLFTDSSEFGLHRGLGVIPGHVRRFPENMIEDGKRLKVPHMGWNQIRLLGDNPLFQGIDEGSDLYFVHSFYVIPDDPGVIAAKTVYGIEFCSALCKGNIFATQFHPEKSQETGLRMLKNFAAI